MSLATAPRRLSVYSLKCILERREDADYGVYKRPKTPNFECGVLPIDNELLKPVDLEFLVYLFGLLVHLPHYLLLGLVHNLMLSLLMRTFFVFHILYPLLFIFVNGLMESLAVLVKIIIISIGLWLMLVVIQLVRHFEQVHFKAFVLLMFLVLRPMDIVNGLVVPFNSDSEHFALFLQVLFDNLPLHLYEFESILQFFDLNLGLQRQIVPLLMVNGRYWCVLSQTNFWATRHISDSVILEVHVLSWN